MREERRQRGIWTPVDGRWSDNRVDGGTEGNSEGLISEKVLLKLTMKEPFCSKEKGVDGVRVCFLLFLFGVYLYDKREQCRAKVPRMK